MDYGVVLLKDGFGTICKQNDPTNYIKDCKEYILFSDTGDKECRSCHKTTNIQKSIRLTKKLDAKDAKNRINKCIKVPIVFYNSYGGAAIKQETINKLVET